MSRPRREPLVPIIELQPSAELPAEIDALMERLAEALAERALAEARPEREAAPIGASEAAPAAAGPRSTTASALRAEVDLDAWWARQGKRGAA